MTWEGCLGPPVERTMYRKCRTGWQSVIAWLLTGGTDLPRHTDHYEHLSSENTEMPSGTCLASCAA